MAQTIKLKRSAVAGGAPTTSQLELGEVAINTYDGKMYIKKSVAGTESIVEISGAGGAEAIFVEYLYTATASQTAFSGNDDNSAFLSYEVGAIQVFLNGILLDPETDYTATNGALITLASAAAVDDYLQIFAFKKKISDGNVTVDAFSGNNSTTAFTLTLDPGDENNTRVFIDGVYQSKSNYTVSGTTLTFSTAPPSGTAIEVEIGNRVVTLDTLSDLDLPDNVKLRLGTSQDLEIYHNATDSVINQTGTGDLLIQKDETTVAEFNVEGLTVTGSVEADEFIGDVRGAVLFKAQAGESLAKGEVVYISGISGNTTIVSKADADDASKMPAFGLVAAAASSGNPVDIYTNGILSGIDTSSYSEGDELFVSTTAGALTATPPTGESSALQKIGKVTRSASNGSIFIVGAGRSNAVSNLDDGDIFIGNSSNQAVSASLNTKIESYLDGGTSTPTFSTINSGNITTTGELRGPASFTIDPAAVGDNTGTVIIKGNLQVDGATTTINSTTLTVDDLNLTLASGAANGTAANGAGITIDGASATLTYASAGDNWAFNKNVGVTGTITTNSGGGSAILGSHLDLGDNQKARFGAGDDLQIYHDATNSYIDSNTGRLYVTAASSIRLTNSDNTENYARFNEDGSVQLYYDNAQKFATTSSGIDVTGTATMDGLTVVASNALGTIQASSATDATLNITSAGITAYSLVTSGTDSSFAIKKDGAERMRIGSTGIIYVNGDGTGGRISGDGSGGLVLQDGNGRQSFKILSPASGSSDAMTLDASGNLLVGRTNPSFGNTGHVLAPSGFVYHERDGGDSVMYLNRLSSDGDIVRFYKDSTTQVGSISVDNGDNLYIGGSAANHSGLYFGTHTAAPITAGTLTDAVTDLGTAGYRFKDLYLSGTIALTTADNASAANMFVSPSTDFLYLEHPANGMIFRNTSGAERMRIDSSGNVGIGVVPTDFTSRKSLDIGLGGKLWALTSATETGLGNNFYFDGTYKRLTTNYASRHIQDSNGHTFDVAVSGSADSAISWNTAMLIDAAGKVGIGTSTPGSYLGSTGLAIKDATRPELSMVSTNTALETNSHQIRFFNASAPADYEIARIAVGVGEGQKNRGTFDFLVNNGGALTSAMHINRLGNVGIGRTDPQQLLEVHKAAGGDQTVAKFSAHNYGDTGKTFIEIGTEYGDGSSRIGSFNDTGNKSVLVFDTHDAGSGSFAERMRIGSSGQVKIANGGSLNFDAAANGNYDIAYKASDNTFNIISNSNSAAMGFHTNSTERMRIDSTGGLITKPAIGGHAVFNENGIDADFRVESDSLTHALFVEGNTSNVYMGSSANIEGGRVQVTSAKTLVANIPYGMLGVNDNTAMAQGVGGAINFTGMYHTNGAITSFGSVEGYKTLSNNGNYDGTLILKARAHGGNQVDKLRLSSTEAVFNEDGVDTDFRVESERQR